MSSLSYSGLYAASPFAVHAYATRYQFQWKEFHHEVISTMIKENDMLRVSDRSINDLRQIYEDEAKDKELSVIINVGAKRSGKSFCACMESLFLCAQGCHFKVGEKDDHCTVGIDISPPLPMSSYFLGYLEIPHKYRPEAAVIIDIEGFDSKNQNVILNIAKIWAPITSICVQSCLGGIDSTDVELFNNIHQIITESNDNENKKFNIKYMLAVPPTRKVSKGQNWRDIKETDNNVALHLLPLFDSDSTVGECVKEDLQNIPYLNPVKHMEKKHIAKYREFATDMAANLKHKVDPNQILDAIDKTVEMAKQLQ